MSLQCNGYAFDVILDVYPTSEERVRDSSQFQGSRGLSGVDKKEEKDQEFNKGLEV